MGIMDVGYVQDVRLTDDFQLPLSYRTIAVKRVEQIITYIPSS